MANLGGAASGRAFSGEAVLKKDALRALESDPEATLAQAKAAYRRLAMKWHPDRNSTAAAEGEFKRVAAAYQALEAIEQAGLWGDPWASFDGQTAWAGSPPLHERQKKEKQAAAPKPRERNPWDPPRGRGFDMGPGQAKPRASARAFCASFMDVLEEMFSQGVGPKMAGATLARGFHGYLGEMEFEASLIPELRGMFLEAFWSRRLPGAFAAFERAREICERQGWALSVVAMLNPLERVHGWEGGFFYLFDQAGKALPTGRPGAEDLAFYREWIARMPELFENFGEKEKALRFGLGLRGGAAEAPWMEQALKRAPKVAEIFAPLTTPKAWGGKSEWTWEAVERGLGPSAIEGWLDEEPLDRLCSKLSRMARKKAARFAAVAQRRMELQGDWSGAGPWSTPQAQAMARAQKAWEGARQELAPAGWGKALTRWGKMGAGVKARKAALEGPAESVAEALREAKAAGALREALDGSMPLALACGMRAFFDDAAPMDFMERAGAIEQVAGLAEVGRKGNDGLSGIDWFERALSRRAKLSLPH